MRYFKLTANAEETDIINTFFNYIEVEEHNIFTSYFKPYTSHRKGLHTYIDKEKVSGYYENGVTTHTRTQLLRSKSWFFAKIKDNTVKGFIIGDIYLILGTLSALVLAIINYFCNFNSETIANSFVIFIFGFVFLYASNREQKEIYNELKALIKKAEWLSGNKKGG